MCGRRNTELLFQIVTRSAPLGYNGNAWGMSGFCLFVLHAQEESRGVELLKFSKCGIRTSPDLHSAYRIIASRQKAGWHWSTLLPSGVLFLRAFLKVVYLLVVSPSCVIPTKLNKRTKGNRGKWHKREQRWHSSVPHLEKAILPVVLSK